MDNFRERVIELIIGNDFEISDEWQTWFYNNTQNEYGLLMNIEYAINREDVCLNFVFYASIFQIGSEIHLDYPSLYLRQDLSLPNQVVWLYQDLVPHPSRLDCRFSLEQASL